MSDRSRGNGRERSIERRLNAIGFRTMRASASGRHGQRKDPMTIDGDLIALAPDSLDAPHLLLEIGGKSKSVRASIAEMTAQPLPAGFTPIVVRLVDSRRKRWRWHIASDVGFDTLDELLDAIATR